MIQEILTGIAIIAAMSYILLKLKKTGSTNNSPCGGCSSNSCNGCPALDLKAEAERRKQQQKIFSSVNQNEKKLN
ncbi:MAG: hypothetical protein ACP5O2_03155 [Bacteroidales bacterium]